MSLFYLAFQSIRYAWAKSLVIVLATALIIAVPLVTQDMLNRAQDSLNDRAESTPLLLGRQGAALDLALSSLYFDDSKPTLTSMALHDEVWDTYYADAIPVYRRFTASNWPIVGTSLDYFDFRGLELAQGRTLIQLGEAVLGFNVAQSLGLAPGDTLLSDPENLFDLGGIYPLEMQIVGVLDETGTPDDEVVFVDTKTAWVIEGIGHGHDDVVAMDAEIDGEVVANARQKLFTRITDANRDSFHFHGGPSTYPITGVIALPYDHKAETILRGRYLDPRGEHQIIRPSVLIQRLIDTLFQIKKVLDLVVLVVALAALIGLALAIYLSAKLRADEMRTNYLLGASRGFSLQLLGLEVLILVGLGGLLAWALLEISRLAYAQSLISALG